MMRIIITNKAVYFFMMFLVFLIVVINVGARIDFGGAYHYLQDIIGDDNKSIDANGNGIVDRADKSLNVEWQNLEYLPSCNQLDIPGNSYLSSEIACSMIYIGCKNTNTRDCDLSADYVAIGQDVSGTSFSQPFKPQFARPHVGGLYASFKPYHDDSQYDFVGKFNTWGFDWTRKVPSPRQVDVYDGYLYVAAEGMIVKTNGPQCYAITEGLSKPRGIFITDDYVYITDEANNKLYKYTHELRRLKSVTISRPYYLTGGTLDGQEFVASSSFSGDIYFFDENLNFINKVDTGYTVRSISFNRKTRNERLHMVVATDAGNQWIAATDFAFRNGKFIVDDFHTFSAGLRAGVTGIYARNDYVYMSKYDEVKRYDLRDNEDESFFIDPIDGTDYGPCDASWQSWKVPSTGEYRYSNKDCSQGEPLFTSEDVKGGSCSDYGSEIYYCYGCENPEAQTGCIADKYICE